MVVQFKPQGLRGNSLAKKTRVRTASFPVNLNKTVTLVVRACTLLVFLAHYFLFANLVVKESSLLLSFTCKL